MAESTAKPKPRLIAVVVGSESDIRKQCKQGFDVLEAALTDGDTELYQGCVIVSSIHRMHDDTIALAREVHNLKEKPDAIIVGAGKANHLTGTFDAYLRHALKDDGIRVIGVAFEGEDEEDNNAAVGSITQVPGTQVLYNNFFGAKGFAEACRLAVSGDLATAGIRVPEKDYHQRRIPFAEAKGMVD
jgi:phosphoribosylcarboxyaminoimidazole (NCAIR) mutase